MNIQRGVPHSRKPRSEQFQDDASNTILKSPTKSEYRVGLLANIPTPYRIPLFNKLVTQSGNDLHVAFNASIERNRRWHVSTEQFFSTTMLSGRTLSVGSRDLLALHFNWGTTRWLKRGCFDAVILGGWSSLAHLEAAAFCHRSSIPLIVWSGSTAGEPSLARRISRPVVRWLVRISDGYIAYGSAAADYLEKLGARRDKISIAYNTVDLDEWKDTSPDQRVQQAFRSQLGIDNKRVFLYVGQLIERKGVDILISAFARAHVEHDNTVLLIAGAGPQESLLRGMVSGEILDTIRFLGHRSYAELPALYNISDVIVLPSRSEVWGLTINEAMASGRPVITTSITGASRDLVDDGKTGWIIPPRNAEALYHALTAAMTASNVDLAAMGRLGQERIFKRFTIDRAAEAFSIAVSRAVQSKKASRMRS